MELSSEEKFERAMKLSAKAGVSLEDAKAALNACEFDMLDAIVYLEKLGKVTAPNAESYSTKGESRKRKVEFEEESGREKSKRVTFGDLLGRFFKWCGKIIKIGNENYFDIDKNQESFIHIPLTVMVLLLAFAFWFVIPLLIVGLFFSFRYSFSGPLFRRDDVFNNAMNKASDVTENLKKEFADKTEDKDKKADGETDAERNGGGKNDAE